MNDTKHIVITSIFPPTEAVRAFARQPDWQLIVVGDRKSPAEWQCEGAHFISADEQQASDFNLARLLPWNHYCRKMLGYLVAARQGAQVIVDTDDDNAPKPDWAMPAFDAEYDQTPDDLGFINIYRSYTDKHIWA